MSTKNLVSKTTRKNWLIDAGLFTSALFAALSGIYFLFLPKGGFRGGRNPLFDVQIIFSRQTWDDIHTWAGVAMIAIAVIHLSLHWRWVTTMVRQTARELSGKCRCSNPRGRWNLTLNALVAISFLLTTVSGIYFLFFFGGRGTSEVNFFFSRTTWDLVHTWAGVTLIITAILHFVIHWKWVTKVTRNLFFAGRFPRQTPHPQLMNNG